MTQENNIQSTDIASQNDLLLDDVRFLIEETRNRVAHAINFELSDLHWQIGTRVRMDILGHERADYGKQVIEDLAANLTAVYGKGYSRASLFRMVQFAERFPNREIVASLMRQLSWTHWVQLIAIDDALKREFYTQMCRVERWSVRTLQSKIKGMLFERTALSRKPEELARQELASLACHHFSSYGPANSLQPCWIRQSVATELLAA